MLYVPDSRSGVPQPLQLHGGRVVAAHRHLDAFSGQTPHQQAHVPVTAYCWRTKFLSLSTENITIVYERAPGQASQSTVRPQAELGHHQHTSTTRQRHRAPTSAGDPQDPAPALSDFNPEPLLTDMAFTSYPGSREQPWV